MVQEACAQALSKHLDPGDELLWADSPKQGLLFTTQDFFLLPFAMFGCGFAYFLTTMPDFIGAPQAVAYFGWVLFVISLYFFLFRFWVDASLRAKTCYGLTHSYVIIKIGNKAQHIYFRDEKLIKCDANVDSSGNIWFKEQSTPELLLGNSLNGLPFIKHPKALLFIPNVKAVHNKILALKKQA